jgi:hypothetical protein
MVDMTEYTAAHLYFEIFGCQQAYTNMAATRISETAAKLVKLPQESEILDGNKTDLG